MSGMSHKISQKKRHTSVCRYIELTPTLNRFLLIVGLFHQYSSHDVVLGQNLCPWPWPCIGKPSLYGCTIIETKTRVATRSNVTIFGSSLPLLVQCHLEVPSKTLGDAICHVKLHKNMPFTDKHAIFSEGSTAKKPSSSGEE